VVQRLLRREPHAVVVSARTGHGIHGLVEQIEARLPRPQREVDVLLPYDRGDLVSRLHDQGEILAEEHTPHGTRVHARVKEALAGELEPYAALRTAN
jgi:GTP-binding protein HflX